MAALNFLRCYQTEPVRGALFKMNVKLVRDLSWYYVGKIAALKAMKIVWPEDHEWDTTYILRVDGTHFRLNEIRDEIMRKNPKWYSHKDHHPGLNYEIAIHLWKQQVVHAKTSDPSSKHDITVFREELKVKIPNGKRVIGDNGYHGESEIVSTPNLLDSAELKQFKKEARARCENSSSYLMFSFILSTGAAICYDVCGVIILGCCIFASSICELFLLLYKPIF